MQIFVQKNAKNLLFSYLFCNFALQNAFDNAIAPDAARGIKATRVSALPTTNATLVCVGDPNKIGADCTDPTNHGKQLNRYTK